MSITVFQCAAIARIIRINLKLVKLFQNILLKEQFIKAFDKTLATAKKGKRKEERKEEEFQVQNFLFHSVPF